MADAPPRDPTPEMLAAAETFVKRYVPLGVPEQGLVELWQTMFDAGVPAAVPE